MILHYFGGGDDDDDDDLLFCPFGDPVHAVWVATDHFEDGADFSGWWFGDQVGGTQAPWWQQDMTRLSNARNSKPPSGDG